MEIFRRVNRCHAGFFQFRGVLRRDNAADDYRHIEAGLFHAADNIFDQGQMASRQHRKPDNMRLLRARGLDDLLRRQPDALVNDLHAGIARTQKAHVVGLSVLSGSHLPLVEDVVGRMKKAGLDVPVVVGGIIPPEDAAELEKAGVAAVYTPKDFELNRIMSDVVRIVERAKGASNV